jgi:nucleoside-diphosphate-sugar epimerase
MTAIIPGTMKRVLVIGGTGLMGLPTVRHLLAAGHHVTVLSRGAGTSRSIIGGSGAAVAAVGGARGSSDGGAAVVAPAPEAGRVRDPLPEGVSILVCDRETEGARLRTLLSEQPFDAIVDYFAMTPAHVEDVISAHKARCAAAATKEGEASRDSFFYLFISTNMVYPGGPADFDISPVRPSVAEDCFSLDTASTEPDTCASLPAAATA